MRSRDDLTALRSALQSELPGARAKEKLAPQPSGGRLYAPIPHDARSAAVLIALVPDGDALWAPFIERVHVAGDVHSGQIALPGGSCEVGEQVLETALRETHEEIGLPPDTMQALGDLTPQWIPVSGYVVHPVVALADRRRDLVPDAVEVQAAFWLDLQRLRAQAPQWREMERGGRRFRSPGWSIDEGFLWGATAMMLAEFFEVLDSAGL